MVFADGASLLAKSELVAIEKVGGEIEVNEV
jgi:hypothetical protein